MSRIIMEGFRTDSTLPNSKALLTKELFWFDRANNLLKVGHKALNYYVDATDPAAPVKVLTLTSQAEDPSKVIAPVEFSVLI